MGAAMYWLYVLLTALVPGFLATWLGVGGCFLRIPMIMYFFGASIKEAYCVNQAVIALTTVPGVIIHYRHGYVHRRGLLIASAAACLGVSLGAYAVARYVPRLVLRVIFGMACALIGAYVLGSTLRGNGGARRVAGAEEGPECGAKLFALMFLAGFATGLCGFGGGIYFVPVFMGLGYATHVAIGTSSAEMIFTGGLGSSILAYHGHMNPSLFLSIGVPTLVASYLGAKAAKRSPPRVLRLAYAVLVSAVGLYVAVSALAKLGFV